MEHWISLACWIGLAMAASAVGAAWWIARHAHHVPNPPAGNVIRFEDLREH